MNLNENKRCENFDIDNDKVIFDLFKDFADEIFELMPEGIIEDRDIVDPVFDKVFGGEKAETNTKISRTKVNELFKNSRWGNG